jgi:phosphatidate cytidylyltransferase
MLKTRIITALVLFAAFIPALFMFSSEAWAVAMLAISLLAIYEWGTIIKLNQFELFAYTAICTVLGVLAVMLMKKFGFHWFFYRSLIAFLIATIFWSLVIPVWLNQRFVIGNKLLMALLGVLLIVPLWLALICARGADPRLLLILLSTIWIADSAAYFAGKNFGKNKLAPTISPGKTWEGVFGALLAVTLFAGVLHLWFDVNNMAVFPLLWIVTIFGVIGDLFESLMKRQANIKDSGDLLPGHGGILDRIDGLIPSLPIGIMAIYAYNYAVVTGVVR